MAKRKMENVLIKKDEIDEELQLIKGSSTDYITPSGRIFSDYGEDKYYPKKSFVNKHNGYVYVNITGEDGKYYQKRLHRLLAEVYIPNPNNLPYVMHKDNDKSNYNLENLQWGTAAENTKQAFEDGLIQNDKGFSDSQAVSVCMYDLFSAELLHVFGSISIASKEIGVGKHAIIESCESRARTIKKPFYFRYKADGNIDIPSCIGMYDAQSDELIHMYINCGDASKNTGVPINTITAQVSKNKKPRYNNKRKVYFARIHRN